MKTTKEKVDELVKQFYKATTFKYQEYAGANYTTFEHDKETLINCAILSVKHCIETLQYAFDNQAFHNDDYNVLEQLEQQKALLTELESRL